MTEEQLRCGDCSGLTRDVLISGESVVCSSQGKLKTAKACPKFRPDVFSMDEMLENDNTLVTLAKTIRSIPDSKLTLVASVILNDQVTRKAGYKLMQPVYVRYRGTARSDYMSNFMTARVLFADKDYVKLVSDTGRVTLTYVNNGLAGPTIYSVKEFRKIKQSMIDKGRNVDPAHERATSKALLSEEGYDFKLNHNGLDGLVVTMDEVAKANGIKGKKPSGIYDLVSMTADIERGEKLRNKGYRKSVKGRDRILEAGDARK